MGRGLPIVPAAIRDPHVRTRTRVYVISPSEWGQRACDHLLHRCVAHDGSLTLVVAVRDAHRFRTAKPAVEAWSNYESVEQAVRVLRDRGAPIEYVYDDRLPALQARMQREREEGNLVVVYVASQPEWHQAHVDAFCGHADRILVEKPYSIVFSDVFARPPQARKSDSAQTLVLSAEHYMFRPGVTMAITELSDRNLRGFLERNAGRAGFRYDFCFEEAASHDDPNRRLGAYKDGSILDIAVVHGLGPIARLLLPVIGARGVDDDCLLNLAKSITWTKIAPMHARDENGARKVATLAETGVEIHGVLDLRSLGRGEMAISLRSIKGAERYNRHFGFSYQGEDGRIVRYGVSLGANGYSMIEGDATRHDRDGGEFSDRHGGARRGAANAQAAMLDAFVEPELDRDAGADIHRFIPLDQTLQILQLALRAQGHAAAAQLRNNYRWGVRPPSTAELRFHMVADDGGSRAPLEAAARARQYSVLAELLGLSRTAAPLRMHTRVTVLGDEGEGQGQLAECIEAACAREGTPVVHLRIPVVEAWSPDGPDRGRSAALSFALARLASSAVPRQRVDQQAKVLIISGVQQLSAAGWRQLVEVLERDYEHERLWLFTTRADRSTGLVLRTQDCRPWLTSEGAEGEDGALAPASEVAPGEARLACRNPSDVDALASFTTEVHRLVGENLTARRQTWAFLELQWRRLMVEGHGLEDARVRLRDHVIALARPRPITPDAQGYMDRLASLMLAEIDGPARRQLESMAIVECDLADQALFAQLWPELARELSSRDSAAARVGVFEHGWDGQGGRKLVGMFPRVRAALLDLDVARISADSRAHRRRVTMCALQRRLEASASEGASESRMRTVESMYTMLAGSDPAKMSFARGYFAEYVEHMFDAIEALLADSGRGMVRACALRLLGEAGDLCGELRNRLLQIVTEHP